MAKKFNYEIAAKGMLNAIKGWGDIQAQRAKITAAVMENEIKQKNNLLYKLAEYKFRSQLPNAQNVKNNILTKLSRGETLEPGEERIYKETMMRGDTGGSLFPENNTGGMTGNIITDRMNVNNEQPTTQPTMQPTGNNFGRNMGSAMSLSNPVNLIKMLLQKKEQKGYPLSQKEQEWKKKYAPMPNQEDKLFPEENEVNLPEDVTTTSQAIDYLQSNYNMSQEEAIDWIRSQQ